MAPDDQKSDAPNTPSERSAPGGAGGSANDEGLRQLVIDTMKTVYDPEIPVNIYDLGMVYEIEFDSETNAIVTMTLTSPSCPVAGSLPLEVEEKLNSLPELKSARVDVVWDPPWTPDMISEAAKLELGIF
jgi:FeS assembly SUF system protein